VGPDRTGLEGRLILQKNFDRVILAYNVRLEAEWAKEKGEDERGRDGEVVQSMGASLELSPNWFIGAELVREIPPPEWHTGAAQNVFIGPNVSYHANFVNGRNWALTTTALARVTDAEDEPAFQLRAIFEFDF